MRMYQFVSLGILLALPLPALAAPQTFGQLATLLIQILNAASGVAVVMAIAIFFWGISTQMFTEGGAKRSDIIWGVIALFVMVSIWGILNILSNTFFSGSTSGSPSSSICSGISC